MITIQHFSFKKLAVSLETSTNLVGGAILAVWPSQWSTPRSRVACSTQEWFLWIAPTLGLCSVYLSTSRAWRWTTSSTSKGFGFTWGAQSSTSRGRPTPETGDTRRASFSTPIAGSLRAVGSCTTPRMEASLEQQDDFLLFFLRILLLNQVDVLP